jgi:hypothetical protein
MLGYLRAVELTSLLFAVCQRAAREDNPLSPFLSKEKAISNSTGLVIKKFADKMMILRHHWGYLISYIPVSHLGLCCESSLKLTAAALRSPNMLDLINFDAFLRDPHVQQALGDVLGLIAQIPIPNAQALDVVRLCLLSGVAPAVEAYRSAGARVGSMLAAIHSDAAFYERLGLKEFINPDATELLENRLVGKIKEILMEYLPPWQDVEGEFQCVEDEAELLSGIIRTESEH